MSEMAMGIAATWVCMIGVSLLSLIRHVRHNKKLQDAITGGPTGPVMLVSSFLVLDQCIKHFETESECTVRAGDESHGQVDLVVIASFCTMFMTAISNLAFENKHRSLNLVYVCVKDSTVIWTYSQMFLGFGAGLPTWRTSYGSFFKPARVNLWMHSSMAQVLCLVSSPSTKEYGIDSALSRVFDVYIMFIFGFLCTALPPAFLPPTAGLVFSGATLVLSFPFMVRVLMYMHQTLPLFLHIPERSGATALNRMLMMKILPVLVCGTWCLFPLIWLASAFKWLSPNQEQLLLTWADVIAKASATIVYQHGNMASSNWKERTEQASLLQASHSVVAGFKLFTQCIGHDLRTPMQALIFSNLKARQITQELIADEQAAAAASSSKDDERGVAVTPRTTVGVELAQKTRCAERLEVVLHKQEEVGACAELITCIVSNIWDFEKLQGSVSGQAASTAEASVELNINETVGELMQMLRKSSLYKPSVALRTVFDDMIPAKLWGQRSILVRALLNLISNSLKFTDGGHVTVHTCLLSGLSATDVRVRVEVVDTGYGMTKDEIERARQAYVSGVREMRDNRASGLGLGLPIVISSIESVGGTFQIDSRAGEGTRCSIEMVLTREDPLFEGISQEKEKETREREKLEQSCKTIAIVDDVEMIRLGAADVLENQGHRVLLESDGDSGLEMLKQNADELYLALVDIQMPNMRGDELIVLYRQWELAERPGKKRLRIYACTGKATSTDSAAYIRAGFDGCISKPVYPQTFKALLSSSKLIVQSALVVGCQHSHFSSGSSSCSSSDSTPPSPGPLTSGEWSTASPMPSMSLPRRSA